MRTIGILDEPGNAFSMALIDRINGMRIDQIGAEYVQASGIQLDEPIGYRVIIDRLSQTVPFYRAYLKNAVLNGTVSLNHPLHRIGDNKFFSFALMSKLDVAIPPMVFLPPAKDPLVHPTNWEEIFNFVGFPAFLKSEEDGQWKESVLVNSRDEFFVKYNALDHKCITFQRAVNFQEYLRCFVIGSEKVHIVPHMPGAEGSARYPIGNKPLDRWVHQRVTKACLTIGRALDYDIHAVDFAVEDDVPYAVDFLSPIPDADPQFIGQANFEWLVNAVADLAIRRARGEMRPVYTAANR